MLDHYFPTIAREPVIPDKHPRLVLLPLIPPFFLPSRLSLAESADQRLAAFKELQITLSAATYLTKQPEGTCSAAQPAQEPSVMVEAPISNRKLTQDLMNLRNGFYERGFLTEASESLLMDIMELPTTSDAEDACKSASAGQRAADAGKFKPTPPKPSGQTGIR